MAQPGFLLNPLPSRFQHLANDIRNAAQQPGVLRAQQLHALDSLAPFFQVHGDNGPALLALPTGSGKSGVIVLAPYWLAVRKVLILAPGIHISRQLQEQIYQPTNPDDTFLLKHGIINRNWLPHLPHLANTTSTNAWNQAILVNDIIVVNVQKMHRNNNAIWQMLPRDSFDLIIVDEAHHFPAGFWAGVLAHFNTARKIFLTATPYRTDGREVVANPPGAAYRLTRQDAHQAGIIRGTQFVNLPSTTDAELLTYIAGQLAARNQQFPLAGNAPHLALIIASSKAVCEAIAQQARTLNIAASAYHSDTPNQRAILHAFETGRTSVLVICQMLLEGYDCPKISVLGIMHTIRSPIKFDQFVGRGVRCHPLRDPNAVQPLALIVTQDRFAQATLYEDYRTERWITV